MGPSAKQWAEIAHRVAKWGGALKREAAEHGVPNTWGVVELALLYGLTKRHGYYLGFCRLRELSAAAGHEVTYSKGRFAIGKNGAFP